MRNFVKFVGRQSSSQDYAGNSKIVSFTVFSSTVSNLSKDKDGKLGTF